MREREKKTTTAMKIKQYQVFVQKAAHDSIGREQSLFVVSDFNSDVRHKTGPMLCKRISYSKQGVANNL
jgi:hypothetical protein